ncbi:hypothetical protein [Stratiformator vulcanicus]|uniref:Ribosomal protein L7/L12 C-terminal domain-containing protein n=1 Tax=Stratiformator vulcanicus TaxID=2527980 RepID=A0A517R0J0_9PLAN|nr:hypothetical protein [Stratiformator vulcanicus]QDT37409.1 hypothetical protein Pan189_17890 [Stratiformator vulcanicus]
MPPDDEGSDAPTGDPTLEMATGLLKDGHKIAAIKVIREGYGVSLKEAKQAADRIEGELGITPTKVGCGGTAALLLVCVGLSAALATAMPW